MKKIRYVVKRGLFVGTVLTPHLHQDNHYVVSFTRFAKDYHRVKDERELPNWVAKGFSVRMSNPAVKLHRSPSLITPGSIEIYEDSI